MINLKNKRVTVMGLGLHGGAVGTVRWLAGQGAQITVTDLKSEEELADSLTKLRDLSGVRFVLGEHREDDFREADMVVRNPAVRGTSKYLAVARDALVPIEMDSSLFFQACPSKNIIGVTGSKGKTTCARAIARLLKASDADVVEVGTDGVSPLSELPSVSTNTVVVFELSSWRLEALNEKQVSPATSVVVSLYRDHLNTYDSLEDYIKTKKTIMRYQKQGDRVLLNADDERLREWAARAPGQVLWFSLDELVSGDGIFVRGGTIMVRLNNYESALFPLDAVSLEHEHERRNILPGVLLASLAGVSGDNLRRALSALRPLPHRLERVREIGEVTYINDSAATVPEATIAALRSLAGKRLVHILGGGDKKLEFDELARVEKQGNIYALIYLPGTATNSLKAALTSVFGDDLPPSYDAADMPEAVQTAARMAQLGGVVLLSPAATSFGLFLHEFDRGDQFREAVNAL